MLKDNHPTGISGMLQTDIHDRRRREDRRSSDDRRSSRNRRSGGDRRVAVIAVVVERREGDRRARSERRRWDRRGYSERRCRLERLVHLG